MAVTVKMLIVFKHKSFSPWSKNHCADTLAILFTWRCCLEEHFSGSLVNVNPDVWCWDVWYITLCNWKMGSLYVGLQAEIMTSPWKRGLGHNEVPNGILGRSLCRTWKKLGLLLRHIQSLTECFYPMPPTYSSSTKHKQVRQTWFMGGWPAKFWTWVDNNGNVPGRPFPTVTSGLLLSDASDMHQTLLMESRVVCRRERPCGFNAFSSTYCIDGGSAHLFFRHQCFVNDGLCNLLLPLR